MLTEALINLGLNEKEAKAYLALLPLSNATAYMVATKSGLKKPTAHVILDSLVSKGFALKIPYDKKHCFIAKSPRECLALAKEKISTVEDALPKLLAIQKSNEEKPSISYYEGLDGIKQMYSRLIKTMKNKPFGSRSFVAFFAHQKDTPDYLQKYWLKSNEELSALNIRRQALTTHHKSIEKYLKKDFMEEFRYKLKSFARKEIFQQHINRNL